MEGTGIAAFIGCLFLLSGSSYGIQVTVQNPFNVVILFQQITLKCNYQTSSTQPPIVVWKYKSFCRDRLTDALNPTSQDSQINSQLQQNNPGYNPYVECQDSSRTVRIVATKQGNTVTLGDFYQGRRITISNTADLSIEQTAWGDSGVYYCSVISNQDLLGNNEAYSELLVLGRTSGISHVELLPDFQIGDMEDWLFVVLMVLGGFFVFLLIGVCWCQCCPHTCCCYVRCPCCPEKCCCPRALYEAGKAATAGVPSIYAPSVYAPSVYSHPSQVKMPPPGSVIQMGPVPPMYNGYGMDYDAASSVGGHSSQAPLIRDNDGVNSVRSGYRIQANQQDDSMRVLYYMEKELANFDPSRPGEPNNRFEKASAMSEISSLHDDDRRNNLRNDLGRLRNQPMTPIRDIEEESLIGSEYRRPPSSRQDPYDDRFRGGGPPLERRGRARSVDDLDDNDRRDRYAYRDQPPDSRNRRRRNSDDDDSSRGYSRTNQSRSPDPRDDYYGGRRSRSRDDLSELGQHHRDQEYDDRFLEDVLRRKQQRAGSRDGLDNLGKNGRSDGRRNRNDDDDFPPPPPPYTETESLSSRGKKLKRGEALSRESLVV